MFILQSLVFCFVFIAGSIIGWIKFGFGFNFFISVAVSGFAASVLIAIGFMYQYFSTKDCD